MRANFLIMKYKSILVQRKFSIYSNFLDTTLQIEADISMHENLSNPVENGMLEANKQLEAVAAKLKIEADSMRGQVTNEVVSGSIRETPPIGPAAPQSYNKEWERAEIDFDNAQTVEQLIEAKAKYDILPGKLMIHYKNRLDELCINK
jgi:hypothetical protein